MQFCNTNTFEGTAKIDFVYFSISCSEFVISIKNVTWRNKNLYIFVLISIGSLKHFVLTFWIAIFVYFFASLLILPLLPYARHVLRLRHIVAPFQHFLVFDFAE